MNAIAFFIQSLLTSVFTAIVIEFIRTGYGFTQGEFTWFESFWSSWAIALAIHAVEFVVKLSSGSLNEEELPQSLMLNEPIAAKHPNDYGAPLQ